MKPNWKWMVFVGVSPTHSLLRTKSSRVSWKKTIFQLKEPGPSGSTFSAGLTNQKAERNNWEPLSQLVPSWSS